jgi:hypothetical protein
MPSRCFPTLKLRRVRVTELDECGRPVYSESPESPEESPGGEPNNVVSDGVISLNYEEDYEEGEEYIQKNGWGELCQNERDNSQLKRALLTVNFCFVDPEMFSTLMGVELIVDAEGNAIGYIREEGPTDANFALEGWTGVGNVECGVSNKPYGYVGFYHVTDVKIGGVTFENGTTSFEFSAWTRPGAAWGTGPYDVQSDFDAIAPTFGPLDPPVRTLEHYRKFLSNAPLPTPGCGIQVPTV